MLLDQVYARAVKDLVLRVTGYPENGCIINTIFDHPGYVNVKFCQWVDEYPNIEQVSQATVYVGGIEAGTTCGNGWYKLPECMVPE